MYLVCRLENIHVNPMKLQPYLLIFQTGGGAQFEYLFREEEIFAIVIILPVIE